MAKYYEKIGEMIPDNLIANIDVKQIVVSGTVAAGTGIVKRGTVMAIVDGSLSVYGGTEGQTPYGIMCDDIDATGEDVVAEIYVAGCFNKNALIVADGYALSADDIQTLRNGGIFVENSVKM